MSTRHFIEKLELQCRNKTVQRCNEATVQHYENEFLLTIKTKEIMTLPRGIRNHNPLNIRRGDQWQG